MFYRCIIIFFCLRPIEPLETVPIGPEGFKDLHTIKRVILNTDAVKSSSLNPKPTTGEEISIKKSKKLHHHIHPLLPIFLDSQIQQQQVQSIHRPEMPVEPVERLGILSPPPLRDERIQYNNRTYTDAFCSPPRFNYEFNNINYEEYANNPHRTKLYVAKRIFNGLCFEYNANNCSKENCKYSHILPHPENVLQELLTQPIFVIECAYKYILATDKLFVTYFPIFCELFGRNQQVHSLIIMIRHCESINRPITYYKYIIDGLMLASLDRTRAVELLLQNMTSKSLKAYDVILDIILESDVTAFLPTIEMLLREPGYVFPIKHFNHLLEIAKNCRHSELVRIMLKGVTDAPTEYSTQLNVTKLTDFLQMVRELSVPKTTGN